MPARRTFHVEFSFDGERWHRHQAINEPPAEFSERERWYGEDAVGRVMRATYGDKVRWRWVEKTPS
jgi:hypothetical protein